jgi:hypothetical protein
VWLAFYNCAVVFFQEITATLSDPGTQWIVFVCLGSYFLTFGLLQASLDARSFWRTDNPTLWLSGMLVIGALAYALNYGTASQSVQAPILFAGAALGQGSAVWWIRRKRKVSGVRLPRMIIGVVIVLLFAASLWGAGPDAPFKYRGQARWSGPLHNPNLYGLLMGVGIALAAGASLLGLTRRVSDQLPAGHRRIAGGGYVAAVLYLVTVGFMSRALIYSYSRGAWIGSLCGLAYLIFRASKEFRAQGLRFDQRVTRNMVSIGLIAVSTVVLGFWHFRQTEWRPVQRTLSIANMRDFSWRNRVLAWEGALQMMADRPWLGTGWNMPESLYQQCYRPPKVEEGMAIQMNDYLMIGASLGLPALACFVVYLWLCFANSRGDPDWFQTICRSGAIVLAVGFWFDGGLFELPTASTFWILMGLGQTGSRTGQTGILQNVAGKNDEANGRGA